MWLQQQESMHGVDRKRIRDWVAMEMELHKYRTGGEEKKRRVGAGAPPASQELDAKVADWLLEEKVAGRKVTNNDLQKKGKELAKNMSGLDGFCASAGWLRHWKTRQSKKALATYADVRHDDVMELVHLEEESWSGSLMRSLAMLYEQQSFCDLCIKARDNEVIFTHSLVLLAACPSLTDRLTNPESNHHTLRMDIPKDSLAKILDFIYYGELSFCNDQLLSILDGANKLRLRSLQSLLQKHVMSSRSAEASITMVADIQGSLHSPGNGDMEYAKSTPCKNTKQTSNALDRHDRVADKKRPITASVCATNESTRSKRKTMNHHQSASAIYNGVSSDSEASVELSLETSHDEECDNEQELNTSMATGTGQNVTVTEEVIEHIEEIDPHICELEREIYYSDDDAISLMQKMTGTYKATQKLMIKTEPVDESDFPNSGT